MFPGPNGPGFPGYGVAHILSAIVWAIGSIIVFAIVVALLVLLVRFLIIGTKAAQLYLDTNGQAKASGSSTPAAATPESPVTTTAQQAATAKPSTKPVPRPRTPKAPPSA